MAAVICTYRRKENLTRVLEPLLADPALTETVVVVDGCHDGSIEVLRELARADSRIKPVFIENRGPIGAHQVGVEHASTDVVLLLADDVVAASPRLVTGHARHHASADGLVVVGYMPTVIPKRRRPGQFATYLYAREYEASVELYERDPSEILRGLWGGNISMRRSDCLRVKLATPDFPIPYLQEDQEFGIRCMKAGLVGRFDRSLLAHHIHSRSLEGFLAGARNEAVRRALFHQLHEDVLGPMDESYFQRSLPTPLRFVVRACRNHALRRPVVAIMKLLVRGAGRSRQFALETRGAQLLRRIEQDRAVTDFLRQRASPSDWRR